MKYTACLLVGLLCLLMQNMAFAQEAKLSNLRAFDGINSDGEVVELVIDFTVTSPELIQSLVFVVYKQADVELLTYQLNLKKTEEALYFSDGIRDFRIYQNGLSLFIVLPESGYGQWSHVLLQGVSTSGQALNSLLTHNENL